MEEEKGNKPKSLSDPDPTEMTTLQLRFTETGLRTEIQALKDIIGARLDGMDEATRIQLAAVLRYPSDIERAIAEKQQLHDKDIESVRELLHERNLRFQEVTQATDKALDLAAKLTEKQIDGLKETMTIEKENSAKDTNALVSRLDRMEALALGLDKAATSTRQAYTVMISGLGVLMVAIGIVVSVLVTRS
jgi:hypothetical protein